MKAYQSTQLDNSVAIPCVCGAEPVLKEHMGDLTKSLYIVYRCSECKMHSDIYWLPTQKELAIASWNGKIRFQQGIPKKA